MALDVNFANGDSKMAQIDPWTTTEQITGQLLKSAGIHRESSYGWSLDFDDEHQSSAGDVYSLNGDDYVLDMIAQMELLPSFRACKNYFIGYSGSGLKPKFLLNPYNNPEVLNKFNVQAILDQELRHPSASMASSKKGSLVDLADGTEVRMRSLSGEAFANIPIGEQRSAVSSVNGNGSPALGLAVSSRLNERYIKSGSVGASGEDKKQLPPRSESATTNTSTEDNGVLLKLSEKSRLNQRYIQSCSDLVPENVLPNKKNRKNLYTRKNDKQHPGNKLKNKRSFSMQELGLASGSSLNIRYFSRDKLHKAASFTEGSEEEDDVELNLRYFNHSFYFIF